MFLLLACAATDPVESTSAGSIGLGEAVDSDGWVFHHDRILPAHQADEVVCRGGLSDMTFEVSEGGTTMVLKPIHPPVPPYALKEVHVVLWLEGSTCSRVDVEVLAFTWKGDVREDFADGVLPPETAYASSLRFDERDDGLSQIVATFDPRHVFEEHGTFYFGVRSTPGPQDGRLACLAACSRHAMPDLVYLDPANDYELNDGWYDLQLQDFGMGSFMWAYTSD